MTDEDKALVENLRDMPVWPMEEAANLIEAQAARLAEADALLEMQNKDIERLKDALETWIFHHQRAMGEKPDVARQYAKAWMFRNADGEEPE